MKKIFILILFNVLIFNLLAQKEKIDTYTLHNGMNVVLCEDHAQPQIYGAVCVHVGSKNDPADNTGMAHYLEHIMFKGTDQIGTLDWKSEKVYLDSIRSLYDQLHDMTDAAKRNDILLHINNLSNKATQYAIPNEVDVILDKMGGEGVNAFTSNDVTVYHNKFPSNQLEKWLTVYTERFRNPIFRLFQSELEAVYEEYNMYQDNPIMCYMEDALAEAFDGHPYGRPVIGYQQHLKNPQTSAMQKFFNTYYHPANMTLLLVGDFDAKQILPLLEKTIGELHNQGDGVDPKLAQQTERMDFDLNLKPKPIVGKKIVTVKETPVKMGIIGYRTVGTRQKDAIYLDILSNLLNNESSTGLLDKLNNENKVFQCMAFNYSMLEEGAFALFYVPKILGQSHEQAEELMFAAIDSLKNGNFSDDLFEAVKMTYLTDYLTNMETLEDKFYMLLDLVTNKQDPNVFYRKLALLKKLSKKDLIEIANKYFTDDCLVFRSNMGIKHHEKLQKPNWSPVIAENTNAQSDFAKRIEAMPVSEIKPQNIDFESVVNKSQINEHYTLYSSKNPKNDVFTLAIVYNYGTNNDKKLETAINYVNQQGTQQKDFSQFQLELQKIGASLDIDCSYDKTFVYISGFDKDMKTILTLCREKLMSPANDEKVLQKLIEEEASAQKMQKNDASIWGQALFDYARYGEKSSFINKLTIKELKKIAGADLLKSFRHIFEYDGYVIYVGNIDQGELNGMLKTELELCDDAKHQDRFAPQVKTYEKPTLFLASNKHFLQSNIYFYIHGIALRKMQERVSCEAYNEYMSGSMAGVIFQEIRELRSLGYSAYGGYNYDAFNRRDGYLYGYLGTQSDKTGEGCEAMAALLADFPEKPDKFENAKLSCLKKMEATYIGFRDFPWQMRNWEEQGYKGDPRLTQMKMLQELSFEDLREFYKTACKGNPLVITVAGDKKRINIKELEKNFQIIELKYNDIFK